MKNKEKILTFVLAVIITCIIFIPYLTGHMAVDTYRIYNMGYDQYAKEYSILDGRTIMGVIEIIAGKLNISIESLVVITTLLAIIISCITVMVLYNIIENYKKPNGKRSKILLFIISYYAIFNFMYIENMYFVDCVTMAISVLCYIISANSIIKKENIKAAILVIIGIVAYQGTIGIYFLAVILFTFLDNKEEKGIVLKVIKNLGISILMSVVGIIVDNIQIIVAEKAFNLKQTRGLRLDRIILNILFIIENMNTVLIRTANILPPYLYIIIVLVVMVEIFVKIIIDDKKQYNNKNIVIDDRKQYNKKNTVILQEVLSIVIISMLLGFIVSIINLSAFWSGRIRYTIGATVGFIYLLIYAKTDVTEARSVINNIIIITFILYGIYTTANYIAIMNTSRSVKNLDEIEVNKIEKYIENYEETEGISVDKVAVIVIEGNTSMAYYQNLSYQGSVNAYSGIKTEWSIQGVLNYYTHRNLERIEATEDMLEECKNKMQGDYICIGDTICVNAYMY